MAMIEINKDPSRRMLGWFGLMFAAFFGLVGVLVQWHFAAPRVALTIWIVAAVITVAYYVAPPLRRPLYVGWMYAAYPIGWTVSHLIMAGVYYLVVTPIGLVMRLVGYDPMRRRIDRDADSYWIEREQPADTRRYFQQF